MTLILKLTLFISCISSVLSSRYLVDPSASSGGSGNSWQNAIDTLDTALTIAIKQNDEIWLKGGFTYIPSNPMDRSDCFVTTLGLTIYGGFGGTETSTTERSENNPTSIISGDIGISNDVSDNCYHVISYTKKLTLDGVTIQHGYANYDVAYTSDNKVYAMQRYGGALITTDVLSPTTLRLNNVVIRNNTAVNGGALWFAGGISSDTKVDAIITDSIFEYNSAMDSEYEGGYGGAIYAMFAANVTLLNTEFNSNSAALRGGAIYEDYGAWLYAKECIFNSNKVQGWGGAIFCEDRNSQTGGTFPKIISSQFSLNQAGIDGGAVCLFNGVVGTLTDNVFTDNIALNGEGTGVLLLSAQAALIGNELIRNDVSNVTRVDYTDVDDSLTFDINEELATLYSVWHTQQTEWDIYPFDNADALCYVASDNKRPTSDGQSWNSAHEYIQLCLDTLQDTGGEIWVKAGTYWPTIIPQWKQDNGRSSSGYQSFQMYDDIRMYGGFDGTETSRYSRNWRDNPTYLSCKIPNSIQCMQILNAADNTVIDGFVFRDAGSGRGRRRLANQISLEQVLTGNSEAMGAGILSQGSTVTVVNSIFHKLYTIGKGGAVYCIGLKEEDGADYSPIFINVAFLGNRAQWRGGAISADAECHFVCNSCQFKNNDASSKGGAIYLDFDCDPTLIDTVFSDNHAGEAGGCIAADGESLCTFDGENVFTSNSAEMEGGCLYSGSGVSIENYQGFVFNDAVPTFDSNYMSNTGNIGQKDMYGWPFSTMDLKSNATSTTLTTSSTPIETRQPTQDGDSGGREGTKGNTVVIIIIILICCVVCGVLIVVVVIHKYKEKAIFEEVDDDIDDDIGGSPDDLTDNPIQTYS